MSPPRAHRLPALRAVMADAGVIVGALALVLAAGWARPAAAGLNGAVHAELRKASGWALREQGDDPPVTVYARPLSSLPHTAFKGVLKVPADVDPTVLWRVINRIDGHHAVGTALAESKTVWQKGGSSQFFQVMKPPPLVASAQRFWIADAVEERDLGGQAGHHRRCWSVVGGEQAADVRAGILRRYPSATEVPMSHGCWELLPEAGGGATLVYTTVSDPGGSVPDSVARALSAHTLPDNMMSFVRAARAAAPSEPR